MRIDLIHPKDLGLSEVARWRVHQAADPNLASPYLTPEWARIVGEARADARVCVIEDGEGFLGVQRLSRFSAMGLGAPIADYQGVVGAAGLKADPAALCRALGVGRIDLAHVPSGQTILARGFGGDCGSWTADVSGGVDVYRAGLKGRRGKFVRELDKKLRKLGEEHGQVHFSAQSASAAHFKTLLGWKRDQLQLTGQPAIWNALWVRRVLAATFLARGPNFGGVLTTMSAGDTLVAACFFLRSQSVLHAWMIGHDSKFEPASPGVLLARWAIEWAAENGLSEVDFGPGDYQFKRQLATGQRTIEWGVAARPSWSGVLRHAEIAVRARVEKLPHARIAALPGKAMRRFDVQRGLAAA